MSDRTSSKLELELERPDRLLERLHPNGRLGGLTLEGVPPGPVGTRVELRIVFRDPAWRHFTVRTQLSWIRRKGSRTLRECFGVDFLDDDAGGRERLLAFASGETTAEKSRFDRRIGVDLPVVLIHAGAQRREQLADLSLGGAFVRTARPLRAGEEVELSLRPPRALTRFRIAARVIWARRAGEASGMGLEFAFADPKQAERLRRILERLEG